jgi:2,3-bisphosphoglycerate-independent phosphoglycerate mutase
MASEEWTRALLAAAGFSDVRTEDVAVRFTFGEIEEYMRFVADTAARSL